MLLKLKHISAIQIFKLTTPGVILNNSLAFDESGDIDEPLLKQLWTIRACTQSTIELTYDEVLRGEFVQTEEAGQVIGEGHVKNKERIKINIE